MICDVRVFHDFHFHFHFHRPWPNENWLAERGEVRSILFRIRSPVNGPDYNNIGLSYFCKIERFLFIYLFIFKKKVLKAYRSLEK